MKVGWQKCKNAINNSIGRLARAFDATLVQKVVQESLKTKASKPDGNGKSGIRFNIDMDTYMTSLD